MKLALGIESSCDETGIALYHTEHGLLAHALHTQVAMHNEYGGVVPELASRELETLPVSADGHPWTMRVQMLVWSALTIE